MRRLSLYFLTFCALLASAGLLVSSAEGKKHHGKKHHKKHVTKKRALQIIVKGCQQGHTARAAQAGGTDEFDLEFEAALRDVFGARASALQPVAGATVTATLSGPYVTQGNATGTTDAMGDVHLVLKFAGPGTYTVSVTATKTGDTPAKLTKTVNVTGPMNAACALA
jgi:hypothetical protein